MPIPNQTLLSSVLQASHFELLKHNLKPSNDAALSLSELQLACNIQREGMILPSPL